jgi:DNA-binding PadR family transcriptional regulator
MVRGRPIKSEIRQNIAEILAFKREGYGYDIAKTYLKIFPNVSVRVIYYHLKKGVSTKEFRVSRVKTEEGDYSWGSSAEKVYYALGENAVLRNDERVKKFFKHQNEI